MAPTLSRALFGLLLLPLSVSAQPNAKDILAKTKQATGGDAWNGIRTSHSVGKLSTSGLTGKGESWDHLLTGRHLDRYELGPSSGAEGFDGKVVWSQDTSKQVREEGGADAVEAAVNEAYRRSLSYWFPERRPATIEAPAEKTEDGKRYFVLRITPKGGRPFDLWIEAATSLFNRFVEKSAIETRTTFFSDYRPAGGVKLPFQTRSTNGEKQYDQFVALEKVEFNVPIDESLFNKPAPPPPDYAFEGGKTSSTAPFELANNHIYVKVKLNGKGPFTFLCDTGGANILSPPLAKELGLKPVGALQGRGVGEKSEDVGLVKVDKLQLGDVSLSDQLFAVFQMQTLAEVEGLPASGLVGYEIFKRFVVTIDYGHSLLTLTAPSADEYKGDGTVLSFKFNYHIPQVEGEIDGLKGAFDIDTGSRSSLSLLSPFVEKNGLKAKYAPKVEGVTGWGVGGPARSQITRARELRLGSLVVKEPVTEFSLQSKGAFTDPYVAGNVGGGILKKFNITFDYGHQRLILKPNANYSARDVFDRSGLWINRSSEGFAVEDVYANGPAAAAGLRVGDKIVAVDDKTWSQISLSALRQRFKTDPPGTKVRLTVQSKEQKRTVVLVLRELV